MGVPSANTLFAEQQGSDISLWFIAYIPSQFIWSRPPNYFKILCHLNKNYNDEKISISFLNRLIVIIYLKFSWYVIF